MEQKRCISSLTLEELAAELKALGQPGFRAKQIFHWVHQLLAQDLDGHHRSHRDRAVFPHHDCLINICHTARANELPDCIQAVQRPANEIIHGVPPAALRPAAGR